MALRVAVFGAGAVGSYFGGMLARSGVPVTLIGRAGHVEAVARDGLLIDGIKVHERVAVAATTDPAAVNDADVVLFCVKTLDTENGAKTLAAHVRRDAIVVSLQNGIDNVERIRATTGIDAVPAVVYVGAAIMAPGHLKHSGAGNLILGNGRGRSGVDAIASMFEAASVPCRVSDRIEVELWTKFILNLAYNAVSALTQATYGRIAADPLTSGVTQLVTKEVVAVACALGVELDEAAMLREVAKLATVIPQATSSTAQDIARGKPTEIDSLNGYLTKLGEKAGVATPVNRTLHALVKLLESQAQV